MAYIYLNVPQMIFLAFNSPPMDVVGWCSSIAIREDGRVYYANNLPVEIAQWDFTQCQTPPWVALISYISRRVLTLNTLSRVSLNAATSPSWSKPELQTQRVPIESSLREIWLPAPPSQWDITRLPPMFHASALLSNPSHHTLMANGGISSLWLQYDLLASPSCELLHVHAYPVT